MEKYKINFTKNIAPLLLAGAFTYTLGSFMLSANAETNEPKKDNKFSVESVNSFENAIPRVVTDPTFVKRACLVYRGEWTKIEVEGKYTMRTAGYAFKPVFDSMTDEEILDIVNKILEDKDYDNSPYLEKVSDQTITKTESSIKNAIPRVVTDPTFVKRASLVSRGEWEKTEIEGQYRMKNIGYGFVTMGGYSDEEILDIVNTVLAEKDYANSPYLVKISEFYYYSSNADVVKNSEEPVQFKK